MPDQQPSIPSGTVTFLFSDVVGSTRLWAENPDAMSASLRIHDEIFREAAAKLGGHIFATAGDSFAVAFDRASAAVECAELVQQALADVDWGTWPALSIRIGIHQGEAEERDANYFGPTVNQAARIMAVAHGGQTLLTDGVRDSAGVAALDLGTHTLRDIEDPVHLNQLGDSDFPPLWSVGVGTVALPLPRTSLVGRESDVAEVRRLLASNRLVTLVGVGGCGKTRLSIEVAYREVPTHPDGVWFVDLSTIADEQAIPGVLATALGLSVTPGVDPYQEIATFLAPRESLLIVDNCEHVVDAVADLLDLLIGRSNRLRIIATSREMIGVEGEFAWKVPSLSTGGSSTGAQLFVERARAAGAAIGADPVTAQAIAEIVDRLDGMPLAIELAAARTRSMDVTEVRDRLDDRFRLLSGGTRRSRQRQATLEGAVQWSFDLLSDDEREMLLVLSVFQGGFAIADVAAVAEIPEFEAIDLIDSLTSKSLVDVTRGTSGRLRHRLLETIRLFALAQLVEQERADEMRDRHLEHFSSEPAASRFEVYYDIGFVERLGDEYENFRSAALWGLECGRPEATVVIATVAQGAAVNRGETPLIIDALRINSDLDPIALKCARVVLSWQLSSLGEIEEAEAALAEAMQLAEVHPSDADPFIFSVAGSLQWGLGNFDESASLYAEANELAHARYGQNVCGMSDMLLANDALNRMNYPEAIRRAGQVIDSAPNFGFRHIPEAILALALALTDSIDQAAQVAGQFSPVPGGSEWGHLNFIAHHLVMARIQPLDEAARRYAVESEQVYARRPSIVGDLLLGFAYFHYLNGDPDRVRKIVENAIGFGMNGLWQWLALAPAGATNDSVTEYLIAFEQHHPYLERIEHNFVDGPRLLAEEFSRWA